MKGFIERLRYTKTSVSLALCGVDSA